MKFFNLFKKSSPQNKIQQVENTYVDIIISLNKDLEIDLSVFLDDNMKNINLDKINYALACAEFLNISMSDKLRSQIITIIDTQIKSNHNKELVDHILLLLEKMDSRYSIKNNKIFIKPSQVFSKYSI
jgi:hypothetical protein